MDLNEFDFEILDLGLVYYKNIIKNPQQLILDIESLDKKINESKRENELVIVDPVQKERNAAAAISKEKIEKFINSCKEYLHNPSEEFFIERTLNVKDLINAILK